MKSFHRSRIMNSTIKPCSATTPGTRAHISPGACANDHVQRFVHQALKECLPDRIYWCNGSEYERRRLVEQALEAGALSALDSRGLPGCYLHSGNPDKVACGERTTLVCTAVRET